MDINAIQQLIVTTGITALTQNTIKSFFDTHITPLFQKYADYDDNIAELEEHISEYILRCYDKNFKMNTIVFRGEAKTLDDLYIPLTIRSIKNMEKNKEEEYKICDDCFDFIQKYKKVLIVDNAGMGKSTIVKYLATEAVKQNKHIPIVIELRKLDKSTDIIKYICNQLDAIDKSVDTNDIKKMLRRGDFIIFFDGYDEILNEEKAIVIENIQEFINKAYNNLFLLTSREENDLNSFSGFQSFKIKNLEINEAYSLIERYDNNGELSKKLIKRIDEDNNMDILKEFLVNPLLVSLLYKTFEYREEIPYKKITFYNEVYEALFKDHDKTKGGAYVHPQKTKLDIHDFEKILSVLGFLSLQKNKINFSKHEILDFIYNAYKKIPWINLNSSDFLEDITTAIPLFCKDGIEYKWIHKSFMEYYASEFIIFHSKENTVNIINNIFNSKKIRRYINILDFCYDLDTGIARKVIVYNFLKEYISFYDNSFKQEIFQKLEKDKRDALKDIMFRCRIIIVNNNKSDIKDVFSDYITSYVLIDRKTILMYSSKNYDFISNILFNKENDIYKSKYLNITYNNKKKITIENCELNEAKFVEINNLDIINELLLRFRNRKFLDYNKCVKLKDAIEKEIQESQIDDFELT